MSAKTNAQSQALAFDFNKMNQKKETLALWQILRQEPVLARNPWAVYQLGKKVINSWGYYWRSNLATVWPSPDEYQKQITQVAMQAIAGVVQQEGAKAKLTGGEPDLNIQKLVATVGQALSDFTTPPPPAEVKARQEQAVANA